MTSASKRDGRLRSRRELSGEELERLMQESGPAAEAAQRIANDDQTGYLDDLARRATHPAARRLLRELVDAKWRAGIESQTLERYFPKEHETSPASSQHEAESATP